MDERAALRILEAYVSRYATQDAAAQALGISAQYLSDLRKQRRPFSDRILGLLGLARDCTIRRIAKKEQLV